MNNNSEDEFNNNTPVENKTHNLRRTSTSGFKQPKNIDRVPTIRNTLPNIPDGDTPPVENQEPSLIPPTPPEENQDLLLIPRFEPKPKKYSVRALPPQMFERKIEEIVVLVDDDKEMLEPKNRDAYFYQKPEEYEKVVQFYYDKYDDDGTKKEKDPYTVSKTGKVYFEDRTNKRVTAIPIRQAVLGWVLGGGSRKLNHFLKWDVSRVTDMSNLFNCEQYLASTIDPKHKDMARDNALRKLKERNREIEREFNRSLNAKNDWKGNILYNIFNNLNKWDVSNVTNMKDMFKYTDNLKNDELPKWYKKTPEDELIIEKEKQRKAEEKKKALARKSEGFQVPTVSCADVSCDGDFGDCGGCTVSGGKKRRTRKNTIKTKKTIKRKKTKKLRKKILKKTKKNRNKLKK